ncbi:hypothetical protein FF36_04839 [Frankia torreyi]|uniref:Uncharacterized protein n=1 Tax=Frankia torreyi TaxID=1856 RepID=A0A0D8B9U7_9ACTN|nr:MULTISPECIES: hypothetical protein [Frankia]KJE20875.1 hypothetical protein FF36_04839 [Frankia torreyi]KQC36657.1 hypothetical protein UK82_19895 [Frankia sp. ACN1ag]KQM02681.1 hypothetical protein FF86_10586 [Frankia sp. CpI1-P]
MTLHVDGDGPALLAELAAVMPAAPALMDRLVNEFAPTAATMATPQAYWVGLNGWLTDRLSGPIMQGTVAVDDVGEQAWAILASSYWGGLELREHWGMPPVIERLGIALSPPFAEVEQGIVTQMAQRLEALRAGGERCLEILPSILREDAPSGPVHGIAYNAGVQVVKTEDPPIGQRRPHRTPRPAAVRINARHFMRVDYDLPTPDYLKVWRSAFERAVTANPDAYEKVIVGAGGQADLRDIWAHAVAFGNTTWGGEAQDGWTDAYFTETIRWSSILTFGLEAAGLAAFVALINQDPAAATAAVLCNALYLGATPGWLIGLLDTGATLPRLVGEQGARTRDE